MSTEDLVQAARAFPEPHQAITMFAQMGWIDPDQCIEALIALNPQEGTAKVKAQKLPATKLHPSERLAFIEALAPTDPALEPQYSALVADAFAQEA